MQDVEEDTSDEEEQENIKKMKEKVSRRLSWARIDFYLLITEH